MQDDTWGDDALLAWDGVDCGNTHQDQDQNDETISVSSIAPSEAGLEGEDEEDWGRDAYLEWAWDDETIRVGEDKEDEIDLNSNNHENQEEEEIPVVESTAQLVQRGMPDYTLWDLKKLQKLVVGYGYRTSNDHQALENVAIGCWKAINPKLDDDGPRPTVIARNGTSGKTNKYASEPSKVDNQRSRRSPRMIERDSSVSSADMPLAQVKNSKAKKGKTKESALFVHDSQEQGPLNTAFTTTAKKGKSRNQDKEKDKEVVKRKINTEDLYKMFYDMIMKDQELWMRMLRYEPINFDELVSKSIATGIDKEKRGWKKDLKRYLDLQSISFFTEDPTGQRRRH
ncbi:uncharacterized protein L201_002123 [Kwoniella dendrophila CBS 6074]|uniref:Structure-specific endonuclease subunit SLX4 n=1 Tax=Kwoniella dendrophila CBS 6074 TaxID=1295534 RepID=A0AAX4JPB3_9TREE